MKITGSPERGDLRLKGIMILIFPFASPAIMIPAEKMIKIFSKISKKTYVIGRKLPIPTDKEYMAQVEFLQLTSTMEKAKKGKPIIIESIVWFLHNLTVQLEMGYRVFNQRKKIDTILSTAGCYYQIPFMVARLCRKTVYCSSFGIDPDIALTKYGRLTSLLLTLLCKVNYSLANIIIVDSPHTSENRILKPYKNKIFIGPRYVEEKFHIEKSFRQRDYIIGYVGRISQEKGIIPFLEAIPIILSKRREVRILLLGSGNLDAQLENNLLCMNSPEKIQWLRWVDHSEIHHYLNQMRLLIVPSATEGMPNIILEAMACGTPVLATDVGGIPNLIIDGESGYILRKLSPQDIAISVNRALSSANNVRIINNGRRIIEERYTFDVCIKRYHTLVETKQRAKE